MNRPQASGTCGLMQVFPKRSPHRDTIPGDTRRIPETPPLSSFLFGSGGVFVLVINAGVGPSICPYPLRREN
jgi:hypothetical protein